MRAGLMVRCAAVTLAACLSSVILTSADGAEPEKAKVLIVTGQNNHDWAHTTPAMKQILEESGRFTVDVSTTPRGGQHGEDAWKKWQPEFKGHDVVVLDYNGQDWPESVRNAFSDYMSNGGGLVVVHGADNPFPGWKEFNEMIGVGGWGGRNEKSGPMLYWQDGKIVRDMSPGPGGTHGPQEAFLVDVRVADHPITKGLPAQWRHVQDELYARLRGPATNLTVLATAFSGQTQHHEPVLMVINYGKGRVFHTVLGHSAQQMHGLGFQITLLRGTEWAATGKVTIDKPPVSDLKVDTPVTRPLAPSPAK